ncbi:helix-turn-helix domain-containing protein [Tumebacillus amylolyticus]
MHERLAAYLATNGLKKNSVAKSAGVNEGRFYRLLDGSTRITVDEYEDICRKALGVHPQFFYGENFLETKKSESVSAS